MSNRLSKESSQYLRQHAENPVDWYPWGDEALAKARDEDKMIFLSIGYSSCHWCHVMERESFEDETVADYLNENYVPIKVDREERPDIDAVYMEAAQMISGHGGWPLNVWLTPDLVPVYAGTYFPPIDTHHRPSFLTVLRRLDELRRKDPDMVKQRAQQMREALNHELLAVLPDAAIDQSVVDAAVGDFSRRYDAQLGGFSREPKFPQAMGIQFLIRESVFRREPELAKMALHSLQAMLRGGIWDALGGGLHRYSTDDTWLVPHFEKMLYDQANMLGALALAQGFYPEPLFEHAIDDMLEFLERDLRDHYCSYQSAIDADTDGVEGLTYIWTDEDLADVLDGDELELARVYYDLKPGGNWEGHHILTRPNPINVLAEKLGIPTEEFKRSLKEVRGKLMQARCKRPQPAVDPKVLAAWNGLLLENLSLTSLYTGDALPRHMGDLLRETLSDAFQEGTLYRIRHQGNWSQPGFLDDYAAVASAMLTHHRLGGEAESYKTGIALVDQILEKFYDDHHNVFWFSELNHNQPVARSREIFDNATPSGTSLAISALIKAGRLSGERRYLEIAEKCVMKLSSLLSEHGSAFGSLLQSVQDLLHEPTDLVIVGPEPDRFFEVWRASRRLDVTPLYSGLPSDNSPLLEGRQMMDGLTTAYLCQYGECRLPVTQPTALAELLAMK